MRIIIHTNCTARKCLSKKGTQKKSCHWTRRFVNWKRGETMAYRTSFTKMAFILSSDEDQKKSIRKWRKWASSLLVHFTFNYRKDFLSFLIFVFSKIKARLDANESIKACQTSKRINRNRVKECEWIEMVIRSTALSLDIDGTQWPSLTLKVRCPIPYSMTLPILWTVLISFQFHLFIFLSYFSSSPFALKFSTIFTPSYRSNFGVINCLGKLEAILTVEPPIKNKKGLEQIILQIFSIWN